MQDLNRGLALSFSDTLDANIILSMSPKEYKAYCSYYKIVKDPLPPSLWLLEKDFKERYELKSFLQISRELGISYVAVKQAYRSGMYKIRKILKKKGIEYEDFFYDTRC